MLTHNAPAAPPGPRPFWLRPPVGRWPDGAVRSCVRVLAHCREAHAALRAVAGRGPAALRPEAEGMAFHLNVYDGMFDAVLPRPLVARADRAAARLRRKAHPDRAYRALLALRTFRRVLASALARHAPCGEFDCPLCCYGAGIAYQLGVYVETGLLTWEERRT